MTIIGNYKVGTDYTEPTDDFSEDSEAEDEQELSEEVYRWLIRNYG